MILYSIMELEKVGLVETDFGFHIIKITDKQDGIV
jgi:parvulin-like peptidyl-prolyl isomerase